jgi:hypothetical protein
MSELHIEPRTLHRFTLLPGCADGLAIESLDAGTTIELHTKHSRYRLVLLDPRSGRAVVCGGTVFPEPCEVRIEGATAGGSALKMGWIGVGLRLELSIGRRQVSTSRVRSITVDAVLSPRPASATAH